MVSCGMKIQCLNLLIRLLAVPACFGYPALVFTTNDVQRHGIIVKQPGHGNFSAALREIAAHPKRKLPDWIGTLPVLIIENASKQPVARLSVRYDLQFSDRPMVTWVHTLIMAEKGLVGGLGPGQSVFVFSGVIHVGPGYAKAPDEQTIASQRSLLSQASHASISLDSIIFEDGRILGPDQNGESDRYRAQQAAVRDMLAELRRLAADGPSSASYLLRLKDANPRPSLGFLVANRSRDRRFHYESMQRRLAGFIAFRSFNTQQTVDYLSAVSEQMPDLK